jgi:arginine repressor
MVKKSLCVASSLVALVVCAGCSLGGINGYATIVGAIVDTAGLIQIISTLAGAPISLGA